MRSEVNNNNRVCTLQCVIGKLWVLAFMRMLPAWSVRIKKVSFRVASQCAKPLLSFMHKYIPDSLCLPVPVMVWHARTCALAARTRFMLLFWSWQCLCAETIWSDLGNNWWCLISNGDAWFQMYRKTLFFCTKVVHVTLQSIPAFTPLSTFALWNLCCVCMSFPQKKNAESFQGDKEWVRLYCCCWPLHAEHKHKN